MDFPRRPVRIVSFSLGKRADISAQDPPEEAKLLKLVLLNCKVDDVNVYPEYNIPFNLIARRAKK